MRLRGLAVAIAFLFLAEPLPAEQSLISRGEYLVDAGGCIDCHTDDRDDARPMAGGRALESPFGIFYVPNITPDKATGIGTWSDDDFVRAMWEGVSPEGDHYYPAFPYDFYTGIRREDLLAMKAFLFSLEPVEQETPEHELTWYVSARLAAWAWKLRYFEPARFVAEEDRSAQWNRGAYLVRHLTHCGACHTPRDGLGALRQDLELAGNIDFPDGETSPNISTHRLDGIGKWSVDDIEYFLDVGMLPDGDFVGGTMSAVIDGSTSKLHREDRLAIATYLKSVPPQASAR